MSLPRVKTKISQSTCYSTETPTRYRGFLKIAPGFGGRKEANPWVKLPGSPGCLPHQAGDRRHWHPPIYRIFAYMKITYVHIQLTDVKVCAENKVFFTFRTCSYISWLICIYILYVYTYVHVFVQMYAQLSLFSSISTSFMLQYIS